LKDLTLDELGYLRNEFFAHQGFMFKTDKMNKYFSSKSWYEPTTRNVTISQVETDNVYFIRELEQELSFGSNANMVALLETLYSNAQRRILNENEIANLDSNALSFLRNTFYARKGYIFYSLRYSDYFKEREWYKPLYDNVDDLLSDLDKKNIQFIQSHE
jgi:hypothetical protein